MMLRIIGLVLICVVCISNGNVIQPSFDELLGFQRHANPDSFTLPESFEDDDLSSSESDEILNENEYSIFSHLRNPFDSFEASSAEEIFPDFDEALIDCTSYGNLAESADIQHAITTAEIQHAITKSQRRDDAISDKPPSRQEYTEIGNDHIRQEPKGNTEADGNKHEIIMPPIISKKPTIELKDSFKILELDYVPNRPEKLNPEIPVCVTKKIEEINPPHQSHIENHKMHPSGQVTKLDGKEDLIIIHKAPQNTGLQITKANVDSTFKREESDPHEPVCTTKKNEELSSLDLSRIEKHKIHQYGDVINPDEKEHLIIKTKTQHEPCLQTPTADSNFKPADFNRQETVGTAKMVEDLNPLELSHIENHQIHPHGEATKPNNKEHQIIIPKEPKETCLQTLKTDVDSTLNRKELYHQDSDGPTKKMEELEPLKLSHGENHKMHPNGQPSNLDCKEYQTIISEVPQKTYPETQKADVDLAFKHKDLDDAVSDVKTRKMEELKPVELSHKENHEMKPQGQATKPVGKQQQIMLSQEPQAARLHILKADVDSTIKHKELDHQDPDLKTRKMEEINPLELSHIENHKIHPHGEVKKPHEKEPKIIIPKDPQPTCLQSLKADADSPFKLNELNHQNSKPTTKKMEELNPLELSHIDNHKMHHPGQATKPDGTEQPIIPEAPEATFLQSLKTSVDSPSKLKELDHQDSNGKTKKTEELNPLEFLHTDNHQLHPHAHEIKPDGNEDQIIPKAPQKTGLQSLKADFDSTLKLKDLDHHDSDRKSKKAEELNPLELSHSGNYTIHPHGQAPKPDDKEHLIMTQQESFVQTLKADVDSTFKLKEFDHQDSEGKPKKMPELNPLELPQIENHQMHHHGQATNPDGKGQQIIIPLPAREAYLEALKADVDSSFKPKELHHQEPNDRTEKIEELNPRELSDIENQKMHPYGQATKLDCKEHQIIIPKASKETLLLGDVDSTFKLKELDRLQPAGTTKAIGETDHLEKSDIETQKMHPYCQVAKPDGKEHQIIIPKALEESGLQTPKALMDTPGSNQNDAKSHLHITEIAVNLHFEHPASSGNTSKLNYPEKDSTQIISEDHITKRPPNIGSEAPEKRTETIFSLTDARSQQEPPKNIIQAEGKETSLLVKATEIRLYSHNSTHYSVDVVRDDQPHGESEIPRKRTDTSLPLTDANGQQEPLKHIIQADGKETSLRTKVTEIPLHIYDSRHHIGISIEESSRFGTPSTGSKYGSSSQHYSTHQLPKPNLHSSVDGIIHHQMHSNTHPHVHLEAHN